MEFIRDTILHNDQKFQTPDLKNFSIAYYDEHQVIAGTADCCFGNVYVGTMEVIKERTRPLFEVYTAPTNVLGMIPVRLDHEKTGFGNDDAVLIAGHGCSGTGIFILSTYKLGSIQIKDKDWYDRNSPAGPGYNVRPKFSLSDDGRITVAFHNAGFRAKINQMRDPKLPSLFVDNKNEEWFINPTPGRVVDLTGMLEAYGLDTEHTLEIVRKMQKWESNSNKLTG